MKTLFFVLGVFFISSLFAGEITGKVVSKKTGEPLPGVNIFISGSTFGIATDNSGNFRLKSIPAGGYKLVFSMIGFERVIMDVQVKENKKLYLNILLEEKVYQTEEVKIVAMNPDDWADAFEEFSREFFGKNKFAERCEILNKEVLNFSYDQGALTATTDSLLIIKNEALGYKISIVFDKFIYDPYQEIVEFVMYPRFDDLSSDKNRESVTANRKNVYLGSLKHLLYQFARRDTSKFTFELYKTPEFDKYYGSDWLNRKPKDFGLKKIQDKSIFVIDSDSSLKAVYDDGNIEKEGLLMANAPYLYFDKFGNILNGTQFIAFGDWLSQRFSMQLPWNYTLE